MIPVTKPHLPDKDKYKSYIDRIYDSGFVTNNGPLVRELEERLADFLGVENIILVANGTLALHTSIKAMSLAGQVITTPFSFAATSTCLKWEGLNPVYADINKSTLNIAPQEIEPLITDHTSAILPVHVFGNPCDTLTIEKMARSNGLRVIYDAAHAFDVTIGGRNVLTYGDVSTLSFHATKLFHTVEGGAIITQDSEMASNIRSMINFGLNADRIQQPNGTNAKMNEFEAAMGLCVLDEYQNIKEARRNIWSVYRDALSCHVDFQELHDDATPNYSYAPILLKTPKERELVMQALLEQGIQPRRYFHPSLNTVFESPQSSECPISEQTADRIICLPIYSTLRVDEVRNIARIVKQAIGR